MRGCRHCLTLRRAWYDHPENHGRGLGIPHYAWRRHLFGGGAMSNSRGRTIGTAAARKQSDIMMAVKAGYHDALAGKGFRPEYERMERYLQRNYDTGRLMGAVVLARAGKPPAWPANVRLPRALEPVSQVVFQSLARQPPA